MNKDEKILREVVSLLIEGYKVVSDSGSHTTATSNSHAALSNPEGSKGPVKEADGEATETRKYKGKTYTASAGSLEALKKHKMDVSKAVESGDFDWADEPYAAAQAAYIVATGKTTGDE